MRTEEKLKDRVQKLLNQAKDREGTPEGDSFYAKAFELMATYGFEERDLTTADAGDEVDSREYTFRGSYTDMQAKLLFAICTALHCTGFSQRVYHSTRIANATVFGLRRHLERVDMLYGLLLPVMLSGAQAVRADAFGDSTVVKRRSFMTGFALSIQDRLTSAEDTAASQDGKYALALLDDASKAESAQEDYLALHGLFLGRFSSNRSMDADAFFAGQDAGDRSDLGQARVKARPALPF